MSLSRRTLGAAFALALSFAARPAAAQNEAEATCTTRFAGVPGPAGAQARNVCLAGVDAAVFYHPVAGMLVSGGNPVLGTGNSFGGLGHFSLTLVRATATKLTLPDLSYDGTSNTVAASDTILAPAPQLDAGIGLWRGLPGSGALAIDALVSAQLVPTDDIFDQIRIDDGATRVGPVALGLGFGARIGVLRERRALPAVSVSVMRRGIPRIGFGDLAGGDDVAFDVDLNATNLRLVASKQASIVSLAAGVGIDHYGGTATITYRNPVTNLPDAPVDVKLSDSRTLLFLDGGLKLGPVNLIGEIGRMSGKDQQLATDFEGVDETGGRTFYSAGIRVGF